MSGLTKVLDRIYQCLEKDSHEDAALLQNGLSRLEIEEVIRDLPFTLSEELFELYQWRNGMSKANRIPFLDDLFFLPLEEALKIYYKLLAISHKGQSSGFEWWKVNYFPVFIDGGGGNHPIACERVQHLAAPVIYVHHSEYIEFLTLTNMMLALAELFEAGLYELSMDDSDNSWERECALRREIYQKYGTETLREIYKEG